jgi:hypothetical protein
MRYVWISEKEQRLFYFTALNYQVLKERLGVFTARYGLGLLIGQIKFRC